MLFNFHGYFKHVEGEKSKLLYHIFYKNTQKNLEWKMFGPTFFIDNRQLWGNIHQENVKKIFDKMCQNLITN